MAGMKDILIIYDGGDAQRWMEYIKEMLCKNDLNLDVECKDLRTDQDKVLSNCGEFLVVSILVSPDMLDTMSSVSDRLAPVLQTHTCVSVILLYTELREIQTTYKAADSWKSFDITDKPDAENKKTVSELINLLEKEREHRKAVLAAAEEAANTATSNSAKEKDANVKPKNPKQTSRGTRHARSILEAVCPKRVSKSQEKVVLILKQPLEGVVQVEFKNQNKKIDTRMLNPYCYSFLAPDLEFGRQQFYVLVDGKQKCLVSLHYVAPTQIAYECPTFLCQALDINPGDMDSLDRRLTGIFRASLPNDEGLSRILSPATLATEAAASKIEHHFPTLLHFAAHHGLRDLCNALLDMPGAIAAFYKTNVDDKDPLDLAEEAGHEDLADFFKDHLEMQETIKTYELYVRMYGEKGTPEFGQPKYLEMLGPGPDRVEEVDYDKEDDYEITKATLASGVVEVLPDEDIVEELKPELPARKPLKATPKPPATLSKPKPPATLSTSPVAFSKPPPERETSQPPPLIPRRSPRPTPDSPFNSPEEVFGMSGDDPYRPAITGSATLDELVQIQEAFKRNEINERDVNMLYSSWIERHKEGKGSASMKERQKQLTEMKEKYQSVIKAAEKKEKLGFFERLTMKKKKSEPAVLDIQHIPTSNPYTSWSIPSGFGPHATKAEREARMSTISNSSTSSSSSYSSSISRDSAMSLSRIQEWDSDLDEMGEAPPPPVSIQEEAPPVPTRRQPSDRSKKDNRKSLGERFLLSVQVNPQSRLPPPPPQHHKTTAHRTASSGSPTPAVKPRKISH